MHTNIPIRHGPEKRITDCVTKGIRIRMANQTAIVGHLYSTKNKAPSLFKTV